METGKVQRSRLLSRSIAFIYLGLNAIAVGIYLMSFFYWDLPVETVIRVNESMKSTWFFLLLGYVAIVVATIVLAKIGVRLADTEKWIKRAFVYLFLFGGALFIGTALLFPRHELRFDGQNMKIDNGNWMKSSLPEGEKSLRQNIRQELSDFIFFMNIGAVLFAARLFEKSKDSKQQN